jgi:hypothetical protein
MPTMPWWLPRGRRWLSVPAALATTLACVLAGMLATGLAPRVVRAQGGSVVVDPGMTEAQVVTRLGEPSQTSHAGSFTYLFYDNECGRKCGMDDVVILERGIVTDAIFRSAKRTFTGASSSPRALPPVAPGHFAPEPIRASTPDDSTHRGGIVLMGPRPPAQPPRYIRVVPRRADSARMASSGSPPPAPGPPPRDTTGSAPHE